MQKECSIMTWIDARRELRKKIELFGDMTMQLTEGRGMMPRAKIDPRYLDNDQYSVLHRTMVAQALSYEAVQRCSSGMLDAMLRRISDPDRLVRSIIAHTCGACGYAPAVPVLIRVLRESTELVEMESIAFALTAIGEGAVRDLIDVRLDVYYVEGEQASENVLWGFASGAIVNMGPDVVDWLLGMFLDEHPYRWISAWAICFRNYPAVTEQKLMKMMRDPTCRSNQMLMSRISDALKYFD
jgi:hypothetical protein